jgi:hypothetical protein
LSQVINTQARFGGEFFDVIKVIAVGVFGLNSRFGGEGLKSEGSRDAGFIGLEIDSPMREKESFEFFRCFDRIVD